MKRRNCPYLGLQYDSSTCHAFPSDHNFCHKVSVPGPVDIDFQSAVCLTEDYLDCPIYNGLEEALPSTQSPSIKRNLLRCGCIFGAIAIFSVLVALAAPTLTGSSGVRGFLQFLAGPTREVFYTPTHPAPIATEPAPTPTVPQDITSCMPQAGWEPYVLQAGDDLVAISSQRGLDLTQVSQGNCNLDLLTLVAGDVIFLPFLGEAVATPTSTLTETPQPSPTATLEPLPTDTFTPSPTPTITPTSTRTATPYYPPTRTPPPPPPTRRPRPTNPPPQPTRPEERPTATPPPVRP